MWSIKIQMGRLPNGCSCSSESYHHDVLLQTRALSMMKAHAEEAANNLREYKIDTHKVMERKDRQSDSHG